MECEIRAYKECYDNLRALHSPIPHSLSETVDRVSKMERKLSEGKSRVRNLTAELKRIEAVVAAITSQKVFSPEMLGQGRRHGGLKEHQQNRYDALERCRRLGNLTEANEGCPYEVVAGGERCRVFRLQQTLDRCHVEGLGE